MKDWRNLNGEKTAFKNLSWFTKHKAFQGNEANYGQRGVYLDLMKQCNHSQDHVSWKFICQHTFDFTHYVLNHSDNVHKECTLTIKNKRVLESLK